MTLLELKQQIVNIENQLSSIDIPLKKGWVDIKINIGLATNKDGQVYATYDAFEVGKDGESRKKFNVQQKIREMMVGDQVEFSYAGTKPITIQAATCKIGKMLGRRYTTRADKYTMIVRVTRVL